MIFLDYIAGIAWGLGVCVASDLLFNEILRNAKNSFTIGEAAVISEGIIMFIAYTLRLLFDDIECNWIEENRISFYAIVYNIDHKVNVVHRISNFIF